MNRRDQYADGTGKFSTGPMTFGMRKVRNGGIIIFDGNHWQDEALKEYIGEQVQVHTGYDDPFSIGPIDVKNDLGIYARRICRIEKPMEK